MAHEGFLVQRMAAAGPELIVGVVGDPRFGPLVAVGAGGTTAELIGDVQVRLAPVGPRDAATMLRELRTFPLLDGFRGAPRADVASGGGHHPAGGRARRRPPGDRRARLQPRRRRPRRRRHRGCPGPAGPGPAAPARGRPEPLRAQRGPLIPLYSPLPFSSLLPPLLPTLAETGLTAEKPEPNTLRLMLVDDHEVVRGGLRRVLEAQPGWSVEAEVGDIDRALRAVLGHRPDILVLDLNLGGVSTLEYIPQLLERSPATRMSS